MLIISRLMLFCYDVCGIYIYHSSRMAIRTERNIYVTAFGRGIVYFKKN
jgi:hypothetical protein